MQKKYSDYIIYVDESGDHSLTTVNKDYPMFVLAFCIFNKDAYTDNAVRKLKAFKFKHFGHDMVVLHENEIRRDKGHFKALKTKALKQTFMDELTAIIETEDFTIIATAINKLQLYPHRNNNPYNLALKYCMELAYGYLKEKDQVKYITHIVVEKRGQKEDTELELEFRRINSGHNDTHSPLPFEIIMAHKQSNSAGLQLADLIARPIGISILKPEQENRAYKIIETKFYTNKKKRFYDFGLKVYP